jgi:hypothetical protein
VVSVLFDADIEVHYGFLSLQPATAAADPATGRAGQLNGLCGAAEPGCLSMTTGLHTGQVPLRIEAHDNEPPVGADWEEVVEVSCTFEPGGYILAAFDFREDIQLPAPGSYRARWCASGMDEAHEADTRMDDEPALDRYLLQLWPAPHRAEVLVHQTSEIAAYWHSAAREDPSTDTR